MTIGVGDVVPKEEEIQGGDDDLSIMWLIELRSIYIGGGEGGRYVTSCDTGIMISYISILLRGLPTLL